MKSGLISLCITTENSYHFRVTFSCISTKISPSSIKYLCNSLHKQARSSINTICHCATRTIEAGTCAHETTPDVSTDVSCPFQFSSTAPKEPWKERATHKLSSVIPTQDNSPGKSVSISTSQTPSRSLINSDLEIVKLQ